MTTARKNTIRDAALMIAGWAFAQLALSVAGHPMSGPVAYAILAGILLYGIVRFFLPGRPGKSES